MDNFEILCEKCGTMMQPFLEESTQGMHCPKCGWSVVTTYISEIELDTTEYEVHIDRGDQYNKNQIKVISKITGLNFLGSKKLLQDTKPLIFKGTAVDVIKVRKLLISAGLICLISPVFPW